MKTKRIILEIEESLHKRIKDFAVKDKRTLTVVLRMMTEEMLEKLVINKENLNNSLVEKSVVNNNVNKKLVVEMTEEEREEALKKEF